MRPGMSLENVFERRQHQSVLGWKMMELGAAGNARKLVDLCHAKARIPSTFHHFECSLQKALPHMVAAFGLSPALAIEMPVSCQVETLPGNRDLRAKERPDVAAGPVWEETLRD